MLKKIYQSLRDAKITYKLFIIFAIFSYILINSWFFSYATAKDAQASYQKLENYTLPSLLAANELKDSLHTSLLAVYDYASTGNVESKKLYQAEYYNVSSSSIKLFELAETQEDLQFTSDFIEGQINKIKLASDKLIANYEANPSNPEIKNNLQELSNLRGEFNKFLEQKITLQAQKQVQDASLNIQQQVNRITYYLIMVIFAVLIIVIFLIFFIANDITKPLKTLTTAAKQFGRGNFTEVKIHRHDELGLFAQTFNTMAKDISATQKALHEELDKTKALDQQKSEFLSIAAHQLRTPMSGLRWLMRMSLDGDLGKLNAEQQHHWQNGLQNTERMIKLINDLLDITKIQQQKFQYNFTQNNIQEILTEVLALLKTKQEVKKLQINLTTSGNLPLIKCDKEKIKIALTNLLDNAIKYSPEKTSIEINLSIEKNNLQIIIIDHGYGIPKDQQKQIFSKFFRGSNILKIETDLETIGTGLGLYIVKDIITKHDGKIWFESVENKGTKFYITLPFSPPEK